MLPPASTSVVISSEEFFSVEMHFTDASKALYVWIARPEEDISLIVVSSLPVNIKPSIEETVRISRPWRGC